MSVIQVSASRRYDVRIESGLLANAAEHIAAVCGVCTAAVVSDDTVFSLYGNKLCANLQASGFRVVSFVFPHGEQSKNLSVYAELLNFLAENRLTRTDCLVALGGGVVGDLCGFAAATYLRGVSFVQIPTTLLAAVDSSVGGKTAVDLPAGKNLVGAFYQPSLVLCDPDLLQSLPEDIFRDGCAEVIKYGLLGNADFFRELLETPIRENLSHVIETCVSMKRDIVCADEFDHGRRQLLNLGHTFGHAVEACSDFSVSHGSAVAIGMAMITRAACEKGLCSEETADAVQKILTQYHLPSETDFSCNALFDALCSDKKISGSRIHLIVPTAVGRCEIVDADVSDVPSWLRAGGAR